MRGGFPRLRAPQSPSHAQDPTGKRSESELGTQISWIRKPLGLKKEWEEFEDEADSPIREEMLHRG